MPQQTQLVEYLDEQGRSPFGSWLRRLKDVQARATIRKRLNRLRLGHFGDYKPVGEGVLEIRVHHGPGYRVYLAHDGPTVVVLLCGGDKRSQARDILRAKTYWREYRS